jgi:DNA-binding response OmpR family regulator
VRRLRQKLELDPNDPHHLLTDPAGGYRLTAWMPPPGSIRPIA